MISAVGATLPISWNYLLAAFSCLLALATPWSSLDCAERAFATSGRQRALWIIAGSIALGIGFEAFHLSGMIAMHLPVSVRYEAPTLLMALLAGMLSSGLLLYASPILNPNRVPTLID